ncbi:hypothetical protein SOVF_184780 [Spinacia oleracea]|nr:hypothetical protein SOVF_184780 [Spinacia oleracea]
MARKTRSTELQIPLPCSFLDFFSLVSAISPMFLHLLASIHHDSSSINSSSLSSSTDLVIIFFDASRFDFVAPIE